MRYKNDLTNKKFNRLLVLSYSHTNDNGVSFWYCLCDCGNTKLIGSAFIKGGYIKSCGCLQKEITIERTTTHNMHHTPLYKRWAAMKARCINKNNPTYGGKGIDYTPEWENFEKFFEDMKEGFQEQLELDRIDVTKGYSKENCRWVTHNENNFNKTRQSNNISGKTGVSFSKDLNRYRAYITVNRKQIYLGQFKHIEDAINARLEGELKYYGYHRQ